MDVFPQKAPRVDFTRRIKRKTSRRISPSSTSSDKKIKHPSKVSPDHSQEKPETLQMRNDTSSWFTQKSSILKGFPLKKNIPFGEPFFRKPPHHGYGSKGGPNGLRPSIQLFWMSSQTGHRHCRHCDFHKPDSLQLLQLARCPCVLVSFTPLIVLRCGRHILIFLG